MKIEESGEDHAREIWIDGPQFMKEYLNAEEENIAEFTMTNGKRWLHANGIGYMDKFGRITICDRKKQLIMHRGCSVFPKGVELLLGVHSTISEVAVAGFPDPNGKAGEIIKAWVALKDDAKDHTTTDKIIAWAKENITSYKVPAQVEFKDELPQTLVEKILLRRLQEA
jgi:long-chain acyl-CoA synthetase